MKLAAALRCTCHASKLVKKPATWARPVLAQQDVIKLFRLEPCARGA